MKRQWTERQLDAITARRGSVLVSAAAGSGKTAVLVQRVIERITDEENPTDADRLLIVTFTKLAAGEMRERIGKAIAELLKNDPGNSRLINQQTLLANAKICTIDSFCGSLARENFELLDIAPDFRTADESELSVVKKEAMDMTLEAMYQNGGDSFATLVELLVSGTRDNQLEQAVDRLYEASRSFPFPCEWLESLKEFYRYNGDAKESPYGREILSQVKQATEYNLGLFRRVLASCDGDEQLVKIFGDCVRTDVAQCEYILDRIENGSWNEIRNAVDRYAPATRGRKSKDYGDERLLGYLTAVRDEAKENMKALRGSLCSSSEDFRLDMEFFAGAVGSLVDTVRLFSENYATLKKEKKLADFSDIMHMALSLLVRSEGDGWKKTELAEEISKCYDEILIDEYQDTNAAQTMLFTSISRNNMFRVGDVKQSIYSFRQAMPEIFTDLKDSLELYDRESDSYPAKIILANNFRSRKEVTDIINFIFEQLMSRESGGIDYNGEERLIPTAKYPPNDKAAAELHLIDLKDESERSSDERQAKYVADIINRMINEGYTVREGDTQRKVRYGDFAVLMRSLSSGRGVTYAEAFRKEGIPSFTEVTDSFLTSKEIALVLNILRIIDNPRQDIPLLSVMMSPVFGFTVDEVADIKKRNRRESVYACLMQTKAEGDAKTEAFLEKIALWRSMSICLPASELISGIYDDTALVSVFDAVDRSGMKSANLKLLLSYADTYEKSGYSGLSGFIRFIDRLSSQKQDLSGAVNAVQNADVVRIMTVHKSKGLEFPVCILANCASSFNKQDEVPDLILNRKYGVAVRRRDTVSFEQYPSVPHRAVRYAIRKDSVSEEMRVLYVALTRAAEKLIVVHGDKYLDKTLMRCGLDLSDEGRRVSPYAANNGKSFGQWIITALLRHPDAGLMREAAGLEESYVLPCGSPLEIYFSKAQDTADESTGEEKSEAVADDDFLSLIKERAEFRYKYEALSGIAMKRTASSVDKGFVDKEHFASSVPAFLCEGGLTGAQKGTAVHRFVQYADYRLAAEDLEGEIDRLKASGLISLQEAAAINRRKVRAFLESDLMQRILSSDKVLREKRFIIEVPLNEIYDSVEDFGDEKVMVQGACDCAFLENGELTVVDYKTDRLEKEEEFTEKYSSQLLLYKKALALCTGIPVSKTLIYSFHLSEIIEVKEKN